MSKVSKETEKRQTRTRFASVSCSARVPARDVNNEPGRSVDVRDRTEDTVSELEVCLFERLIFGTYILYSPTTPYDSAPSLKPLGPVSSFCAKSRLRVISLRMSKWRTVKS